MADIGFPCSSELTMTSQIRSINVRGSAIVRSNCYTCGGRLIICSRTTRLPRNMLATNKYLLNDQIDELKGLKGALLC